jgi:hypothetical protein
LAGNSALSNLKIHGDKFEDMIARRGRNVMWEEGILCSCWNQDSQQPLYNCAACKGKGRIFRAPVQSRVLLTSIAFNTEYEETAGAFQIGDAIMTVPKRTYKRLTSGLLSPTEKEDVAAYNVGMYDIITVMDDDYKSSELLIKDTPIYGRPADTLLNDRVLDIQVVRQVDVVTGTITDYVPDVDYTNDNNRIVWLPGGSAPAEGEQYSVTYHHRPSFTVLTTLPKPRYQDGQLLPRYVALRYRAAGFEQVV